jgi:hypothetical protein
MRAADALNDATGAVIALLIRVREMPDGNFAITTEVAGLDRPVPPELAAELLRAAARRVAGADLNALDIEGFDLIVRDGRSS